MATTDAGFMKVKVEPDLSEFMDKVRLAQQKAARVMVEIRPVSDPLAKAIMSSRLSPNALEVMATVGGERFVLMHWQMKTVDGVDHFETAWESRRELDRSCTIPWRARYKGYWVKPRALYLRLRRRFAI